MGNLTVYLLAELVIVQDDIIRLIESPQLSKSQAALNLLKIIKENRSLPQFLKALERSSKDNPLHGELHEKITKERESRETSQSTTKSKSLNLSKAAHDLFSLPGQVEDRGSEYRVSDNGETPESKAFKDKNDRDLQLRSSSSININSPPHVEPSPSNLNMDSLVVVEIKADTEKEQLKSKSHRT